MILPSGEAVSIKWDDGHDCQKKKIAKIPLSHLKNNQ